MDQDSTDNPKAPAPRPARRGSGADLPAQAVAADDIDPAMAASDEDDEVLLPEAPDEAPEAVAEGPLANGHAAIERAGRAPPPPPRGFPIPNGAPHGLFLGKAQKTAH